jgi:hypothetical protein
MGDGRRLEEPYLRVEGCVHKSRDGNRQTVIKLGQSKSPLAGGLYWNCGLLDREIIP